MCSMKPGYSQCIGLLGYNRSRPRLSVSGTCHAWINYKAPRSIVISFPRLRRDFNDAVIQGKTGQNCKICR